MARSLIPRHMLAVRQRLSRRYLSGQGIEIGALHAPLSVGPAVTVRYVDRLTAEQLRVHYPELRDYPLVEIDILDDGETLQAIEDESLDFIIANHMLEHCENPLGTLRCHLSKLKPSGILYYAIPDKRYSFDAERPLTDFDHLVIDDREGPETSRLDHFKEWVRYVNRITDPIEAQRQLESLLRLNYSIHFHVWDFETYRDFLVRAQSYLNDSFERIELCQNDTEVISILRKV